MSPGQPGSPPPTAVVMEFPITGAKRGQPTTWALTQAKLAEYVETFPSLDVMAVLRVARQWLRDNPGQRKTAGGMTRYLGSFLARQVDRRTAGAPVPMAGANGRGGRQIPLPVASEGATNDILARAQARAEGAPKP